MAASPITGERRPSVQEFRRSSSQFASIPQRTLSFHERAALDKADAAAEVLYSHPKVRIYQFQPPTDAIKNSKAKTLPEADYPIDAIEVLPWRSHREHLANTGQLIIEKVRGSSNFLKAGSLINTIMRNSQCWCVDGESKFVMRVGNFKYQRLEFPTGTEDERRKVDEFKKVMAKILKYECTPCPFIRAFHVSLPEDAITPRRKGQWKRTGSMTPTTPEDDLEILKRKKTSRAWSFKAPPPTSFPSRSFTYTEPERPRTASTPTNKTRFSFGRGTDSPFSYTSGDEGSESDRLDSESDRHESSHNSEVDESDKEHHTVPILKSPLKIVETLSPTVDDRIRGFEELKPLPARTPPIESESVQLQLDKRSEPEPEPEPELELKAPSPPPPAHEETTIDVSAITVDKSKTPVPLEKLQIPEINTKDHDELHSDDDDAQVSPVSTLYNQLLESVSSPHPEEQFRSIDDDLPEIELLNGPEQEEQPSILERDELPPTPPSPDAVDKVMASRIGIQAIKKLGYMDGLDESHQLTPRNRSVLRYEIENDRVSEDTPKDPNVNGLSSADLDEDNMSIVSNDSFHTLASEIPDVDEDAIEKLELPLRSHHRRDVSDVTIIAAVANEHGTADEVPTDDRATTPEGNEIRQRLRKRRTLSPMPSSSNIAINSNHDQEPSLSSNLARRAAALAMVKPIEIVIFVVQILTRIAQGATVSDLVSGELFRRPEVRRAANSTVDRQRQQAPRGRRGDTSNGQATNEEEEDDFGLPLRRKSSAMESPALASTTGRTSIRDEDAILD